MRVLLITLALTLTAMAGCLGGDADGDDDHDLDNGQDQNGNGHNETVEPEIFFSANVTSGEAPLTVLFSIDATGFDQNFTFWNLDVTGNGDAEASGEELPAEFEFTYGEAGNFTVALEVSDGVNTRNDTALITVEAVPPSEEDLLFPWVVEGSVTAPHPTFFVVGSQACISFMSGQSGVDCDFFEVEEIWIGREFTSGADGGDLDMEFRTSCEATSESVQMFGSVGHESGTVPEGAGCLVVVNFEDIGDFTVTIL
jgi:PKD repeat protein